MESEVPVIVNALNSLYEQLKQKSEICNVETQTNYQNTGICVFPKKILAKIMLFLDFRNDMPAMLETCKFFNRLISSYMIQMLFYQQITRIPERTAEKQQTEQEVKENDGILAAPKEEIVKNVIKFTKLRDLLIAGIDKTNEKLKENLQTINKLNDDIRIQKQIFSKTSKRRDNIESDFAEIGKEIKRSIFLNSSYKEEHIVKLTEVTDQIKKIEGEKQILRGHIRTLQMALEDTEMENANLIKKLAMYKENLHKLKNYCNEMLAPKFEKINSTYITN